MKHAVLIATGQSPAMAALCEHHPVPMLPVLDRPFIQHIVEFLAAQGVVRFDVVLSHLPERIEGLLGDATRWGATVRYHLARDPLRPYKLLRLVRCETGEPILLGHADRLPRIEPGQIDGTCVTLFRARAGGPNGGDAGWTGWAALPGERLGRVPSDADEPALEQYLRSGGPCTAVAVDRMLCIRSYAEILDANHMALEKQFEGLLERGQEADDKIWLSRNVILHPTARLLAPVYIGEDCRIDAGVRVGPYVTVGQGCILDTHSVISDCVILPGSYVGESLELDHAIVEKNRLINVRLDAAVSITDDFILGSIHENVFRRAIGRLFSRALGLGLLLLGSPFLLLSLLFLLVRGRRPLWHSQEVLRLPASADESTWRTFRSWSLAEPCAQEAVLVDDGPPQARCARADFLLRFLPGLVGVVRGHHSLVGGPLRSPAAVRSLPSDWRTLYLASKAGLVTEAFVRYGRATNEEEQYAAETVYAATANPWYDAKLLLGYLARVLGLTAPKGHRLPEPDEPTSPSVSGLHPLIGSSSSGTMQRP